MTEKSIDITINGAPLTAGEGATILEAARENGIEIPTLCYHERLTPIGSCRLCVVEVEKSRTLVAACHTPVAPNMVIRTHSDNVVAARRAIVELLLASHPDACLVCDKASQCELRRIAADLEVGLPRFKTRRRYYPLEDVSPYVVRDLSKCILCYRCIKACREIAGQDLYAMAYRGFRCKVVVDQDMPLNKDVCKGCYECIPLCPTGALSRVRQPGEVKIGRPLVIKG